LKFHNHDLLIVEVGLVELCRRQELISEEICVELKAELEILSKMLTALVKGADRRGQ
jgi:hypothetical protein